MSTQEKSWTIGEIINQTKQYFSKYAISTARLDAEILLCHVLNKDRLHLYVHFDQPLQKNELDVYRQFVIRRVKGEPVAYIIAEKHFLNMAFTVDNNVLIPRPETELLAELAIKYCKQNDALSILDVGTGSGALALSIAYNCPEVKALAIDVSELALNRAMINAEKFSLSDRVAFKQADMRDYFASKIAGQKFNLIVSNPPYIPTKIIDTLAKEVQIEPKLALDGGIDGLDFYKVIIKNAKSFLTDNYLVLLEIGSEQAQDVLRLANDYGFSNNKVICDYAGLDRIILMAEEGFEVEEFLLAAKK